MKSARGSGIPSGIARSAPTRRAVHCHAGSNSPPVAARTVTASLVLGGTATSPYCAPYCVALFVAVRAAIGDKPPSGALGSGIGAEGIAPARLGGIVLRGANVDEGSAAAAALLFGGIPVVAVCEANRLGNGRNA